LFSVGKVLNEAFHVEQPLAGNLKVLLDEHGESMVYRHCYSTLDFEVAYAN
jgi:methylmalonyl-CoA/ethylmalonyl-CoA epimerase